jgi:hypothetical protein
MCRPYGTQILYRAGTQRLRVRVEPCCPHSLGVITVSRLRSSGQFPTRSGAHEAVTKPVSSLRDSASFSRSPSTASPVGAGLDYFAPPALFLLRLVPPMQPRTAFRNSLLRPGLTSCRRCAAGLIPSSTISAAQRELKLRHRLLRDPNQVRHTSSRA